MTRLASRFGRVNAVRRDRPLTVDELAHDATNNLAVRSQQAVA
ncbi:TPA: hypothetical protein ACIAIE_001575 [Serratia fonticola]